MDLYLECLGASAEVGRSAFLLKTDKKIMLDYGIKIFDESGAPKFPAHTNQQPDFMVLSHAHLDHSGCLPMLYKNSKIRWYGTPPTKDICEVLWRDSMKIMGEELAYELSHFKKALKYWSPLLYGQKIHTGATKIRMLDAGHISGSAMVDLEYQEKRVLYTGDFKCEDTHMHRGAKFVKDVDVLIIESTYAKKEHPDRRKTEHKLMDEIEATIEEDGNVLLPSFALGRTQELISLIRHYNEEVEIYVDGMGRAISEIYLKHHNYIKDPSGFRKDVRTTRFVRNSGDRKAALRYPSVIISSAGMMNGGPILEYLFNANAQSKIIFTGYCVEGTNGWLLQNKRCIVKDEQELAVDLPVEYLDLSAHAGRTDILNFIKHANPEKIVLVHGEKPQEFADELIQDHGFDALAPEVGDKVKFSLS